MVVTSDRLEPIQEWAPDLFFVAAVFLLVAASHRGIAFLIDSVTFNDWVGLAGLFGRLAALLGTGGLAVQLGKQNARLGKLSRAVVSAAVIFTIGLLSLAILENMGTDSPVIAVFGLGTFLLSVITFSLFGIGIARTGAYSTSIGGLLLGAALSLLVVFVGQMMFPEGVVGSVMEGVLFLLYLGIGYRLRAEQAPIQRTEPATDTTP